ncbi:MAG: hypothetical protein IJ489_10630 [Clostridia bacterium]|nr:hypothetical protein [Clostridia bacterium]
MKYQLLKEQFYQEGEKFLPLDRESISVCDSITENDALVTVERMLVNQGDMTITLVPCISFQTENTVSDYFLPCVSYSGNAFGDGMAPKGLLYEGEPWIFPSDRSGVPGCSVVMGEQGSTALFLPKEYVKSAASLEIHGDTVIQRAFFMHIEYPKAYLEKFRYGDTVLQTVTLQPAESRTFTAYFFISNEKGTFGYRPFIEYLLNDYAREPLDRYTPEIYEYSMSFLRRLIEHKDGLTLSNMGFLPRLNENGEKIFVYRKSGRYECGWCGQNISNAWLLLWDCMQKNEFTIQMNAPFDMSFAVRGTFDTDLEDYRNAIGILDTWQKFRLESGLIPVLLDDVFKGKPLKLDLCNLGWLVYQYVNCYILLKNGGIVRNDYLETAKQVLNVFLSYPLREKGFPQIVDAEGKVICALGMAGTMMTVAALQLYRATGDERYLCMGKDSFDFYYENYLSRNAAAGGALDTYCIDKESAGPVLRAALMLEQITGDRSYLQKAENIACYLQTWMIYYDIPFPLGTDAERTGFTTLGATAVSAQHHHLDCWAGYYAPDLRYLSEITENPVWYRASAYIREYNFQGISDGKTKLHGLIRPAGAQNEAMFQSNWSFDGKNEKGEFNDWLVSWVNAFRLMDIDHYEFSALLKKSTDQNHC